MAYTDVRAHTISQLPVSRNYPADLLVTASQQPGNRLPPRHAVTDTGGNASALNVWLAVCVAVQWRQTKHPIRANSRAEVKRLTPW